MHGAGAEAAQVQPPGWAGSEPGESLRSGMASLSASPVTSPQDSNPVDSASSLAAAAGSDAGALDLLNSPTAASGDQIQGEESASDAVKRRAAAAKSRLDSPSLSFLLCADSLPCKCNIQLYQALGPIQHPRFFIDKAFWVFWRVMRVRCHALAGLSCERVDATAGGQIGLQMLRLRGTSGWTLC